MSQANPAKQNAFALKGSMYTLTVLQLFTHNLDTLFEQLQETIKQSPNFFKNAPLLLDFQKLFHINSPIDLDRLISQLRTLQLIPVGIINANDEQNQSAANSGLGVLTNSKPTEITTTDVTTADSAVTRTSRLINKPVRSGQQIYAKDADLIILGSVSPGAEVIADGNIHIYGTLKGRALAGVNGNKTAHIFCQQLDAELISIAGIYKLPDQVNLLDTKHTVKIFLEDDRLSVATL